MHARRTFGVEMVVGVPGNSATAHTMNDDSQILFPVPTKAHSGFDNSGYAVGRVGDRPSKEPRHVRHVPRGCEFRVSSARCRRQSHWDLDLPRTKPCPPLPTSAHLLPMPSLPTCTTADSLPLLQDRTRLALLGRLATGRRRRCSICRLPALRTSLALPWVGDAAHAHLDKSAHRHRRCHCVI
jgi:hypothetical protein